MEGNLAISNKITQAFTFDTASSKSYLKGTAAKILKDICTTQAY